MTDATNEGHALRQDGSGPVCQLPLDDERPTTRVVEAVAVASDVPPLELSPRLSDVLDPDALDRLFGSRRDGTARFEMGGWFVEVDWADEHVRVYAD